jgi:nucleotide-binding universal stress UspA family protein
VTSLLLNINPDPGHKARLRTAIALVKSRGGHITCVQALTPPYTVGDPAAVVPVAEVIEAMERTAREFQEEVEVALDQAEVQWTWIRLYGDAAAIIVSQSRLSDAIILSGAGSYPTVGNVALHAPAAVVAVPDGLTDFGPEVPTVIAWNGSHPCAHAMRSSVPLLHVAKSVHILVIDKGDEEFPATRALEYLSHHGIDADIHWRHSDGGSLGDKILNFAGQFGAGMIVAGAFGHNRVREMLLGSVTRAMLKNSPLPLFLAH